MDLRLDDSDQLLADGARALLEREAPAERLTDWEASEAGFPAELWNRALELGWLGLPFNEDLGGGGGGLVALGAVVSELGRAACPGPFLATVTAGLVASHLGRTKRARALVEAVARDGTPAALVWPADAAASVSASVAAGPHGHRIVLGGGPVAIEWAQTAETLVCVIPINGDERGCLAVVAVDPGASGVEILPVLAADNERIAWVRFDGVEVAGADHLTADGTSDPDAVAEALAVVRLIRAAEMVGGARRVLDMTVAHVSARRQFGVPLGTFQAVQHACADLAIAVDAARLATWEGLALADTGRSCRRAGSVAGWLAGQAYVSAAVTGAQLHGGLGAIRDYPLHFYYRRAQAMALRLGSEAAQLEELARCLVDPVEAGGATPWVT